AEDLSAFQSQFPAVTNVIGRFDFGLSGGGELIRLYDANDNMVDSLEYDDKAPWPTEPDGDGPTLELISPQLDNTFGANWEASDANGSPGVANNLPTQPIIAVAPVSLSFTAQLGGAAPAALEIAVTNVGIGFLNWVASELPETAWLTLTSTANSVSVQTNIDGLAVGTYNSKIQISATTASNSPVEISVQLTISDTPPVNEIIIAEFEAESSGSLPNAGWKITSNDGEDCIKPLKNSPQEPLDTYRLDYAFLVPAGITELYVFAEVDVNNNYLHDSFWVEFNNADRCKWDNLKQICRDGWKRAWVFNVDQESQHQFTPNTGTNVISFFPHTDGASLNWLVVTSDPNYDIENHTFGGSTPIPPPTDPVISVNHSSLNFSAQIGDPNPAAQQMSISNAGGGTLNWTATEQPETAWLTLTTTATTVTAHANIDGLAAGTYNASIQISSTNATNSPVEIAVTLTITEGIPPDARIIAEFEAEQNPGLPNPGWKVTTNDGENCIKSIVNSTSAPLDAYRLDYTFLVPSGISKVYVFAEVDVNNNYRQDGFWVKFNDADQCHWDNLKAICRDGWKRAWVFDVNTDTQHEFSVIPGTNTISIFSYANGPFLNWLVVTTDPNYDIANHTFGGGSPIPPPTDPVISVNKTSLNFAAQINGTNPTGQQISISNAGGGTLNWTAAEHPETAWLTLNPTANSVSVQTTINGLAVGTYNSKIQISSTNATNSPVEISVKLTITESSPPPDESIIAEFQAEHNPALPNSGWKVCVNDADSCLRAIPATASEPLEEYRLDYKFYVPFGITTLYIFAEVDVNNNYRKDSFWVDLNDEDLCHWDNLKPICRDGWKRAWVFDANSDTQHAFAALPDTNIVSIYPESEGPFINWLVVTTDPNLDISNYIPTESMAKGNLAEGDTELVSKSLPKHLHLAQNYPNPFNPETRIDFDLPETATVSLEVFNLTGQRIALLYHGELAAGHHSVSWNTANQENSIIPSGVYLCRFKAGASEQIIRMMLLK
ncbi:T9SS type A sorting domain-containing protein, partial [bacterium]|nr:T9SS type A sorting domain-containing protein [bacterium]